MSGVTKLLDQLISGDQRALSRTVSLIEEGGETAHALLKLIYPKTKGIRVVGVTGSPGAGKSTLTDRLALGFRSSGKKVAIIAVDPSSPFSGGALLGDRIRMVSSSEASDIFIRSMASRGVLGGLAPRTKEVIYALDAAGYDLVLLETVGVGQGEIEVVRTADTVLVVTVPGMGDGVQSLKAGILEIADLFAINKADYDGVDRLERELVTLLGLVEAKGWSPTVCRTVATTGEGLPKLIEEIERHHDWALSSGQLGDRRSRFLEEYLKDRVIETLSARILGAQKFKESLTSEVGKIAERSSDPALSLEKLIRLAAKSV